MSESFPQAANQNEAQRTLAPNELLTQLEQEYGIDKRFPKEVSKAVFRKLEYVGLLGAIADAQAANDNTRLERLRMQEADSRYDEARAEYANAA